MITFPCGEVIQWRVDGLSGEVMPLRVGPWSGEVRWGGDAVEVYLISDLLQRRGGLVVMMQRRGGRAER